MSSPVPDFGQRRTVKSQRTCHGWRVFIIYVPPRQHHCMNLLFIVWHIAMPSSRTMGSGAYCTGPSADYFQKNMCVRFHQRRVFQALQSSHQFYDWSHCKNLTNGTDGKIDPFDSLIVSISLGTSPLRLSDFVHQERW